MATFDPDVWARVPFHFWTLTFFCLGCLVGSFLNVCIYRMPRGESIVSPPSHCPHCNYSIPWYLNMPLITWLYLRGRCANCRAPIAARYLLVELLTGVAFAACWLKYGSLSAPLALIYCVFIAGLMVAMFIDFEHFIIPDEITMGGIVVGLVCSCALPLMQQDFPGMHRLHSVWLSLKYSVIGAAMGGGVVYAILRLGKLMFGKQKIPLAAGTVVRFTDTTLKWLDQEVDYGEFFYRPSDTISLQASKLELIDRCYANVAVRLRKDRLLIGEESIDPEKVLYMEAVTEELVVPREAMGLGDVKFMAAIGAFLGAPAIFFSLAVSSMIGSVVGLVLIGIGKREWTRLPYGPYIAMAAVIWMFGGREWLTGWVRW